MTCRTPLTRAPLTRAVVLAAASALAAVTVAGTAVAAPLPTGLDPAYPAVEVVNPTGTDERTAPSTQTQIVAHQHKGDHRNVFCKTFGDWVHGSHYWYKAHFYPNWPASTSYVVTWIPAGDVKVIHGTPTSCWSYQSPDRLQQKPSLPRIPPVLQPDPGRQSR